MRRVGEDFPPDRKPDDRRFRPEQRLRRRRDFDNAFTSGIRLNAQVVTIILRPNGSDHSRLGLSVSRRVARHAVARHRLKRHIRESFRHNAARLTGLDVVVVARSGAPKMDSQRFRSLLAGAWERADSRMRRSRVEKPATRDA